ncbi:hypothetical protein [Moheibacter sediminis]|uniref:Outer membrane protein beta-barrel domain-containing protein n=1 Tax=Moheibacter sediminis TaxID=1434700 RepID=A0A1W2A8M8_9FLAO|nr:hypothetical protein [Moheibacter sediminis]SMC57004.1 hypothetical protein SAMN06296427_10421 [Moheibacter sediminis]
MKTLSLILFIAGNLIVNAQFIGVGTKFDKKFMFQATANIPIKFDSNYKFDLAFGVDYTTSNDQAPSGLQPQVTGIMYLVDDKNKSYLIYGGLTAGYLFDFNKEFDSQIRLTPHIYFELSSLFYAKAGVDYAMAVNKVYPFVSIGIGGGHMFRHFTMSW